MYTCSAVNVWNASTIYEDFDIIPANLGKRNGEMHCLWSDGGSSEFRQLIDSGGFYRMVMPARTALDF